MTGMRDQLLRARVRRALRHGAVPTGRLRLRVDERVVRLGGTVPTEADRVDAIAAALRCGEVRGVASQLDVEP